MSQPSRTDRFVKKLASLLVFATYESVDVYEPEAGVTEGPQLTAAENGGSREFMPTGVPRVAEHLV